MMHTTIASRWNADLIDQNYETWLSSPDSLTPEWRAFFEGFELAQSTESTPPASLSADPTSESFASKQSRLIGAIYAYRSIGHTIAAFNPLTKEAPLNPRLTLERLGLEESDLDTVFHTGNYLGGVEMTARELLDRLQKTYCHTVDGVCRDIDTDKFLLKSKNMSDLAKIQEIMIAMEERTYTLDQVLERIIGFYGRFVPFS